MRMAVLQHVPFEGPAAIADWAAARQVEMMPVHLYRGDALPAADAFDMLTVMGGPMSVNDEAQLAWLAPEIAFVREAIGAGKAVFGACLGAQVMAKALGAKVYRAAQKEIGWLPVTRTGVHPAFEGVPASFTAFHWHGETFDLPAGGTHLAETSGTCNQAFAFGRRALGFQFHIEANEASVKSLIENCADEIGTGPFEQTPETMLAGLPRCADLTPLLFRVLDNLTGA